MYTYEDIKKYLSPHITENLICIFKTSSQLFCTSCKDYNYTIITNGNISDECFHIRELKSDFFVRSIYTLKSQLQDNQWRYKLSVCLAKDNPSNIIYGKLPELEIGILNLGYLKKTILPIEYDYALKTYFAGQGHPKTIVWGLALYYFIINKAFSFTDEQKATLQECHDNGYTAEFLADFKTKMENLMKGA